MVDEARITRAREALQQLFDSHDYVRLLLPDGDVGQRGEYFFRLSNIDRVPTKDKLILRLQERVTLQLLLMLTGPTIESVDDRQVAVHFEAMTFDWGKVDLTPHPQVYPSGTIRLIGGPDSP